MELKKVNAIYVDGDAAKIFLLHVDEDADEHVLATFKIDPEHPMTHSDDAYGASACYAVEMET